MKYGIIILSFLFFACSSTQRQYAEIHNNGHYEKEKFIKKIFPKERIVIFNASIGLTVKNPEEKSREISLLAGVNSGYIVSSSKSQVVLRVVKDRFDSAVATIVKMGVLDSKRIYSRDVTDSFMDSKIRLENKLKSRERFLILLKKAENVRAALAVEKELERLNGEIESFKGRLKRMKHLSDYSTITVILTKEVRPGPLGYVFWGAYKLVKWLFIWD